MRFYFFRQVSVRISQCRNRSLRGHSDISKCVDVAGAIPVLKVPRDSLAVFMRLTYVPRISSLLWDC